MPYATCPGCQRRIPIEAHEQGQSFECAQCGKHFRTPAAGGLLVPPPVRFTAPEASEPQRAPEPSQTVTAEQPSPTLPDVPASRWYDKPAHVFFLLLSVLLAWTFITWVAFSIYFELTAGRKLREATEKIEAIQKQMR